MKVAFQMDPITNVDPKADSTFRLAEEAQLRGYSLFYYEPDKLTLEDGSCLLYTSPSPRDATLSRMPSSA